MLKFLTGSAANVYAERKARDGDFLARLEVELENRVDKWLAISNTSQDKAVVISQLHRFIAFIKNGSASTTENEENEMAHIQAQFKEIIYGKDTAFLQRVTKDYVREVMTPDTIAIPPKGSSLRPHHRHAS